MDEVFNEIVLGEFQRDPHGTFIVDDLVTSEYKKVLEKGVMHKASKIRA